MSNVNVNLLNPSGNGLVQSTSSTSLQLRRRKTSRSNLATGLGGNANGTTSTSADQRVKLERIIGLTVSSNAQLACDSFSGLIAYPAGCAVVLYSSNRNRQAHIVNTFRKSITCVTFSPDGKYIATGECGHQPAVRVWDVEERTQIVELQNGHNFGIGCLTFSPDMKYLISVGNQHDNVVNVWNWKSQSKSASNKVSSKVKAMSFAEDGSYFVTVGMRHVKFWYLERKKAATPKYQDTVPLQGRSAILADQRNNYFCDVACGRGALSSKTYTITQSGLLCEFNNRRLIERWLDLKTRCAYAMAYGNDHLFIGCADGTIHVFIADGLKFVATLPRPHHLGVDIANVTAFKSAPSGHYKYPDVVAVCFDETQKKVTCVYNDHSLYQWVVSDLKRVGKSYSSLAHGGCIWGIEIFPSSAYDAPAPTLPPGTFITCGSDDTVRIWNIDANMPADATSLRRNIYSQEMLKIIYADPNYTHLCDTETLLDKGENNYDGKNGVRAVRISPDGEHLASGDRSGNLCIYNVRENFNVVRQLEAHDSEVLCLEYSSPRIGSYFLASASRDRLLHVLDPVRSYNLVCTIDDHSSAITAVKFANATGAFSNALSTDQQESSSQADDLLMLSCGADKSIIIRKMVPEPDGLTAQFVRANYVALQTTIYDMDIDRRRESVFAACQDRQIRVFRIADGKLERTFKGAPTDEGTLIKLELDPSSSYAATSSNDKLVFVVDARSGECVASMVGHGELVTGLKFTNDCRHLITVSGDGCIFIWRLSADLTNRMLARMARKANSTTSDVSISDSRDVLMTDVGDFENVKASDEEEGDEAEADMDLRANLPSWAKKKLGLPAEETPESQYKYRPKGKWATSCLRPEPVGLASTDSHVHGQQQQQDANGGEFSSSGNVKKILKQFETDKAASPSGKITHTRGGGSEEFGLMNARLTGDVDDVESGSLGKENVVYYSSETHSPSEDFVVKERLNAGARSYRGAETLGEASDEEYGNVSDGLGLRPSESVGELHPRQHRMVRDAFEKLEPTEITPDFTNADSSFERGESTRQSITSRYLQRGNASAPRDAATPTGAATGTRSRWNAPTSLPVQPHVLVTSSSPAVTTQTVHQSTLRLRDATSPATPVQLVDQASVARAKNLSEAAARLSRDRRQTFGTIEHSPSLSYTQQNDSNVDYASSDLHHRSRSQSRGRNSEALHVVRKNDGYETERLNDSPTTEYRQRGKPHSYFHPPPKSLVSSRSMTSLLSVSSLQPSNQITSGPTSASMKRLSDIRERLRKSQDNLAVPGSGATTPTLDGSLSPVFGDRSNFNASRSRSFGNLSAHHHLDSSSLSTPRKASTPTKPAGRSRLSTLLQSKGVALSMGNLAREQTPTPTENRYQRQGSLADALRDLKKLSNTDLSQATLTEDRLEEAASTGSFYDKVVTLPRRHASGAVQKKAQAIRSQRLTGDRISISGESEDSSLDYYGDGSEASSRHPLSRSQILTTASPSTTVRHRLELAADRSNSSRSSSPGNGNNGANQRTYDAARQIFEAKQRQNQNQSQNQQAQTTGFLQKSPGARTSSYLAKILTAEEHGNATTTNDENAGASANYFSSGARHRSEGSALFSNSITPAKRTPLSNGQSTNDRLSAIVDSCDNHYDKMSGHCKDSVVQFRTSLDKVLQAYTMVVNDTDLTEDERDQLLNALSVEFKAAQSRLNHALAQQHTTGPSYRQEPEGRRDEGAIAQPPTTITAADRTGGAQPHDASALLQHYSDVLVTMIQEKMCGGK